jgi:uncharacterized protein HemY
MLKKILLVIVLLIVGSGCGLMSSISSNDSYCNLAEEIMIPEVDIETMSDDLVTSLLEHNTLHNKLCD